MENERYEFEEEKEYLVEKLGKKRNKKSQKRNIIQKNQKINWMQKKKKRDKNGERDKNWIRIKNK